MAGGSRAPPAVAERVVSQGFENERHEVVMNDVTVDGHPNLEPERVVTRRVLLTFRPRPLDDRELHDATVRIRWTGDARPLTTFEWTRTTFVEHEEGGTRVRSRTLSGGLSCRRRC